MTKPELVRNIAGTAGVTQTAAESVLDAFCDAVQTAVAAGDEVRVPGFGKFWQKTRKARQCRNPQTGEMIDVAETRVPAFTAAQRFKDVVVGGQV